MLHPAIRIQWINDQKGYGLFASTFIPKGTITWALDAMDRIYRAKQVEKLAPHYQTQLFKYGYRNARGNYILCWDLGKYMNHSCTPNTLSPGLKFDIAVRDIAIGEEVTTDYSSLNLEESLECSCGSPRCRKTILDADFDTFIEVWDESIREAFLEINQVQQFLWPWVEEQKLLKQIAKNGGRLPSIVKHKYRQDHPSFPPIDLDQEPSA